jgi:hypothetical protein
MAKKQAHGKHEHDDDDYDAADNGTPKTAPKVEQRLHDEALERLKEAGF